MIWNSLKNICIFRGLWKKIKYAIFLALTLFEVNIGILVILEYFSAWIFSSRSTKREENRVKNQSTLASLSKPFIMDNWQIQGTRPLSNFSHFHEVFEKKIGQNNSLASSPSGLAPPPHLRNPGSATVSSGRSRIFLRGAPTLKVGVLTYYFPHFFFTENCKKWKNLDLGGRSSLAPP